MVKSTNTEPKAFERHVRFVRDREGREITGRVKEKLEGSTNRREKGPGTRVCNELRY
jgi:hypothetical protein